MIRFLKVLCLLLCFTGPAFAAEEIYEEVGEFIKLDVVFQGKTSGLIWAYECPDCTPKRFLFDNRTVVELTRFSTQLGVEGLDGIGGQPAVMTWIPNTTQVLRVLPMGY